MYMANARNLRLGPNATYIPLTWVGFPVGANINVKICFGDNANFSVFRYQHVGISNAKFHIGGLSQCKDPMEMFCVIVEYIGFNHKRFCDINVFVRYCLDGYMK